jgi:hypothetical protein
MALKDAAIKEFLRRKLNMAKAAKGWTWEDISALYEALGSRQTSTTLTTKHSRGSFRAADMLLMLRAMGVRHIEMSDLDIPGLDEALKKIEARKRRRTAA